MPGCDSLASRLFSYLGVFVSATEKLGAQWRIEYTERLGVRTAHAVHPETGEQLGHLDYVRDTDTGAPHTSVHSVYVERPYRRQGVAAGLYDAVHQETGLPFLHEPDAMEPPGYKLASALHKRYPERHRWLAYTDNGPVASPKRQPRRPE